MPQPVIRYPLDPTGVNPNNLVIGELAVLQTRPVRAITPIYGPFFSETVKVWDNSTNVELVKNVDFKTVEILQQACLTFGKEIVTVILIVNQNISNNVRLNYQVLGGLYQWYSGETLNNMYQTVINDNRPINWVNVLNKPYEFNPTLHKHLLSDVIGWEEVIIAIERLKNAITLSNLPAFEALIDWVNLRIGSSGLTIVSEQSIDDVTPSTGLVTWDRLLYALDKVNFNGMRIVEKYTKVYNGNILPFTLHTTNIPDNTILYWTINNITTSNSDFAAHQGVITVYDNESKFNIQLMPGVLLENNEKFSLQIRKNSINGPVLVTTSPITIDPITVITTKLFNLLIACGNKCCINKFERTTRATFILEHK